MTELGNPVQQPLQLISDRPALQLPHGVVVAAFMAIDFLTVGLCIQLVDLLYHSVALNDQQGNLHSWGVAWLAALLFVAFQSLSGAYAAKSFLEPAAGCRNALLSWLMVAFVIAWIGFLLKMTGEVSRGSLTASFTIGAAATALARLGAARLLRAGLGNGAFALRRAHLIYAGQHAASAEVLAAARKGGVAIAGISVLPASRMSGQRVARTCRELASQLRESYQKSAFDEIYVFIPWERRRQLQELAAALSRVPLPVFLFADDDMERLLHTPTMRVGRFKGFELQRAPLTRAERALKRGLDVCVSLGGLVLLSPLLVAVGLAILATSGRPVVFRQERQGFCGRRFRIYKFRTMRVCEDGDKVAQATPNDPRVTPLGTILRKTSIDELPQLLNVLLGDMSIVGPRPHAVVHDEYYSGLITLYARRQNVKPGITGWAQLHGFRGQTKELFAMSERVKLDLWYIANWSIWLDIYIITATAVRILIKRDAY